MYLLMFFVILIYHLLLVLNIKIEILYTVYYVVCILFLSSNELVMVSKLKSQIIFE